MLYIDYQTILNWDDHGWKLYEPKRKDEVNPKNIRICERHFDSEDYEPDLTSVILFYSYKLSE